MMIKKLSTFDEKQGMILKYLNKIVETSTKDKLATKYWGTTPIVQLMCMLTQKIIYIIEVNKFNEDITITKFYPISPKKGRFGIYIYTASISLSSEDFQKDCHNKKDEKYVILLHRDLIHYNAVIKPNHIPNKVKLQTMLARIPRPGTDTPKRRDIVQTPPTKKMAKIEDQITQILETTVAIMDSKQITPPVHSTSQTKLGPQVCTEQTPTLI